LKAKGSTVSRWTENEKRKTMEAKDSKEESERCQKEARAEEQRKRERERERLRERERKAAADGRGGTQFTCFTSAKVQNLTWQKTALERNNIHSGRDRDSIKTSEKENGGTQSRKREREGESSERGESSSSKDKERGEERVTQKSGESSSSQHKERRDNIKMPRLEEVGGLGGVRGGAETSVAGVAAEKATRVKRQQSSSSFSSSKHQVSDARTSVYFALCVSKVPHGHMLHAKRAL
jgi:hypothetical protein